MFHYSDVVYIVSVKDWGCGSSGRAKPNKKEAPEFKPQDYQKTTTKSFAGQGGTHL
jgi:hypothetical protein